MSAMAVLDWKPAPSAQSLPKSARRGRSADLSLAYRFWTAWISGRSYLWSTAGVAIATLAGFALNSFVPLPNVSMVFLLAVLFAAVWFGMGPALFASGLSFLAYNFFFFEPLYTFSVTQPHELLTLFVLLAVAILTSAIASRAREQANKAVFRDRVSRRLYEFARRLSSLVDPQSVLDGAAIEAQADLRRPCVILLSSAGGGLTLTSAWPPDDQLGAEALGAADLAYANDDAAGAGTSHWSDAEWLFLPLRTPEGPTGVIGLGGFGEDAAFDSQARTLFHTLAELTATALERARLAQAIAGERTAAETERVRNTFLASISHDFRTPLASILGAATSLIDYGARLPEAARRDLLAQVKDETEHLDGMVRNLLAMTRVEAGALEINRDWVDIRELLNRVASLAKRRGATQTFHVVAESALPFIQVDANLIGQALANVVGNAVKYAGRDARVSLEAKRHGDTVLLTVADDGPGIGQEVLPRIFHKFVRAAPTADSDAREGSGLGLAIAKGIVEAHHGSIAAESPVTCGRGTRLLIRLPIGRSAP